MDPIISKEIQTIIEEKIESGLFLNKSVILCPVNQYMYGVISYLREKNIEPLCLFDNNQSLHGKTINNVKVIGSDEIINLQNISILIATPYYQEIAKQLMSIGIKKDNIIELGNFANSSSFLPKDIYEWNTSIDKGKKLFIKIKGTHKYVLVFPYNSLGDMTIIGMYKFWLDETYGDYILTVTGAMVERIAGWFGIKAVLVSEEDNKQLLVFATKSKEHIKVLHYHFYEKSTWDGNKEWQGKHFIEMYKKLLFNDCCPNYDCAREAIYHIKKSPSKAHNKAIVISPYAKSVINLSPIFWEELVKQLRDRNYKVYTNCAAKLEYPIKGTEALNITFEELFGFLEGCIFIGLRSGLCDLLAFTSDLKIILYPGEYEKQLYSLKYLRNDNNIIEIVRTDNEDMITKIMEAL